MIRDELRDDIIIEFTRWRGWPEVGKGMTTHWLDTDAMVTEIQALRQENAVRREELDTDAMVTEIQALRQENAILREKNALLRSGRRP